MNYSKYYFPNGCNICGSTVSYYEEIFKYKCDNCDAWADSHRKSTIKNNAFEPTETLATPYIHTLRSHLRHVFGKLYVDKIQHIIKGEPIPTTIINIIYPDNIVSYNDKNDNWYAKILYNKEHISEIEILATGQIQYAQNSNINKVSNRSKALIWLSKNLNLSFDQCKIGYLSEENLKKSITLCYNAYIKGAQKSLDY